MKIPRPTFDPAEGTGARDCRGHRKAIPDDERVIALDRVLANVDKSHIVPKNVEGIKADPTISLQQDAGGDRQPRWRPDLEPDQRQRFEIR